MMLLKLLKYDFRAMWKKFSLIWGAALVLALVNRFTLFRGSEENTVFNAGLIPLIFICVVVAMFVISIVFVIDRFSKGLLGNEGYLMHTLPVRSWQLVLSKLICGAITWIISGMVAFVSPILMTPMHFWRQLIRDLVRNLDTVLLFLEFFLLLVSAIIQFIAVIYLAVSIGHLVFHHHRLVSVAAFIGLYVLLANVYDRVFSSDWIRWVVNTVNDDVYSSLLTGIVTLLIPAAVFLAGVCWILDHKLNLE